MVKRHQRGGQDEARLLRQGTMPKSFVPPQPSRPLRELLQFRRKSSHRNRVIKELEFPCASRRSPAPRARSRTALEADFELFVANFSQLAAQRALGQQHDRTLFEIFFGTPHCLSVSLFRSCSESLSQKLGTTASSRSSLEGACQASQTKLTLKDSLRRAAAISIPGSGGTISAAYLRCPYNHGSHAAVL